MSTPERILIVNADDFGRSPGVNAGVVKAHERGVLTSASLMVRWPAADAAAAYGRENSGMSLGLHADLGEWVVRDGEWVPTYEVVSTEDPEAVEQELRRQLSLFRDLVGRDPTHLDAHQHVHRSNPVAEPFRALALELGVPLRDNTPGVSYNGEFYGHSPNGDAIPGAISVEALNEIVVALPPGITELGCHPGEGTDAESVYGHEREAELTVLCDPSVRATIEREGILLRSFAEIAFG